MKRYSLEIVYVLSVAFCVSGVLIFFVNLFTSYGTSGPNWLWVKIGAIVVIFFVSIIVLLEKYYFVDKRNQQISKNNKHAVDS